MMLRPKTLPCPSCGSITATEITHVVKSQTETTRNAAHYFACKCGERYSVRERACRYMTATELTIHITAGAVVVVRELDHTYKPQARQQPRGTSGMSQ